MVKKKTSAAPRHKDRCRIRYVKEGDRKWSGATAHVVVVLNAEQIQETLDMLNLDTDALTSHLATSVSSSVLETAFEGIDVSQGSQILDQERRLVIHIFDQDAPYSSMRNIARTVASVNGSVCIHVHYMPTRFCVPLMCVISKHVYTFDKYKSSSSSSRASIHNIYIRDHARFGDVDHVDYLRDATRAIACVDMTRDLENEPANQLTPARFCDFAKMELSDLKSVKVGVMDSVALKKAGMGLVLAVGQGSDVPPRFLAVSMMRDPAFVTVCLVGKGVMFDAGGLRIKSPQGMADMKQDKSGAAIVLTIIKHIGRHHPDLKVNLVGLMPLVENVINGSATKPGDIVIAHNGSSVEITDPDAEGRLILADAISYGTEKFKPDYIIDFATLTNMASTICCDLSAVYYTRNDALSQLVYSLGEATGERVWRHPPWHEYSLNTRSPVADTRNSGFDCTRSGSFMAAMFVSNFVDKSLAERWIHFDISNNDVKGMLSGNCALLGMQLVKALGEIGTKRSVDELIDGLRRRLKQKQMQGTLTRRNNAK